MARVFFELGQRHRYGEMERQGEREKWQKSRKRSEGKITRDSIVFMYIGRPGEAGGKKMEAEYRKALLTSTLYLCILL